MLVNASSVVKSFYFYTKISRLIQINNHEIAFRHLLEAFFDSFSYPEGSSEEMETERRLRRSWPAPDGHRLEELASIFPVRRRAHTSVRSSVIVPIFVLSCLRVDSILRS